MVYFLRVEGLERRHHRHIKGLHSVAAVRRQCHNHHPVLPGDADDLEGDMGAVIVEYEELRPLLRGAHVADEVQQRLGERLLVHPARVVREDE